MLKKLYCLSDSGQRAMYKAAVWLTVFELAAVLPALLMLFALKEMLSSMTGGEKVSAAKYIIVGILLIILMYLSYRKMYKTKYLEAGKENSTMRMELAERLRLLPEEFLSKHDHSDLTSTIMDDMVTVEGALINQVAETISRVPPEELFSLFSIVFQDVTLFNDTVFNNILIGNKNVTDEEVLRAAELAECMPFIERMPEGINTVIGENGHTLSGGERQRLSIARAFLKDAPIILLDESTASLDPETETKIQRALEKLTKGKTVLMIAHRLRSVVNCDRIVVLGKGTVAGCGRHDELIKSCPQYKKIFELQTETSKMRSR